MLTQKLQKTYRQKIEPQLQAEEIGNKIKNNINPNQAQDFDLNHVTILKTFPRRGVVMLTQLIYPVFRRKYIYDIWKLADIIKLPK